MKNGQHLRFFVKSNLRSIYSLHFHGISSSGLEKDEYDRERKFYRERGLPCPKDQALEEEKEKDAQEDEESNTPDANTNMDFHRFDEQVGLQLELKDDNDTKKNLALKRRFIRCSSLATVTHLRKFIAKKLLTNVDKHKDIEIFCNDEHLFKDHTLKFVYVTRWRTKDPPLVLKYCAKPFTEHED